MSQVLLYDTTLRDGMQGPGMSLSAQEKVRVVQKLDELGIDFIEAGFPGSNPKERELFDMLAGVELRHAVVCAFGMTRRRGMEAAEDDALRTLASGFASVVTLVGKTWKLHLEKVTKVDPEENLEMIADSISYLRRAGKRVIYDAEHFFDGYRADPGYALECVQAAAYAGAENVTICDTNGASLPPQIADATSSRGRLREGGGGGSPYATTTSSAGWPTRSRPSARAPPSCRERSTASESAPAMPI